MSTLRKSLPWVVSPLIINAPMAGFAGGALASAVTLAGGLGMIGSAFDMEALRKECRIASEAIPSNFASPADTMPVGIGFLPFIAKKEEALPVIAEFKPVVVWLFAAKDLAQYTEWAASIREVSPQSKIWIQIGSVAAALQVAGTTKPDVLCLQGADAGGHGFEKGAGIISLVPETADTLAREGFSHIPLVASGGIVDGRGVAAALTLGAQAVVMGTRFLASKEVFIHPKYQAAVLGAHDGGQVTTRSKLFDQLRGPNIWPTEYDGRSLIMQSHRDFIGGMSLEEIQSLHNEAVSGEDRGFDASLSGRAAIWAGTGVGLVKRIESAEEVMKATRAEVKDVLSRAGGV